MHDPPLIVPWHRIGDVALGMTKTRVEYLYGQASNPGGQSCAYSYHLHGGFLTVYYNPYCKKSNIRSTVGGVATDSPYYKTPTGLNVGDRIPLGPCHRTRSGACVYRWHEFVYRPDKRIWNATVTDHGRKVYVILWMKRDLVDEISMG
jgi:hypothetical protein